MSFTQIQPLPDSPVRVVGYEWRERKSDGEKFLSVKYKQVCQRATGGFKTVTIGIANPASELETVEFLIQNNQALAGGIVHVPSKPYMMKGEDGRDIECHHKLAYIPNTKAYLDYVNATFTVGLPTGAVMAEEPQTSGEEVAIDPEESATDYEDHKALV